MKTHLALNTAHFQTSVDFYRAFFGQDPVKLKPGYAKFDIENPGLNLTLNENTATETTAGPEGGEQGARIGALNHLGIQVDSTEVVREAADRLKAAGMATFEENDTDCCYALQDKVWVRDPDGNGWEVFVVKVGDTAPELQTQSATCGNGAACCA